MAIFPTPVRVTNRIEPFGTTFVALSRTAALLIKRRPVIAFPSTTSAPVIHGIEPFQNSGFLVSGVPPFIKSQATSESLMDFHFIPQPQLLSKVYPTRLRCCVQARAFYE